MVVAYQIHWASTTREPFAEGAAHVGDTGINRAEYLAVIHGLRLLVDKMYVGDRGRQLVNVVTDNAFVYNQAIDNWNAGDLKWYLDLLREVESDIVNLTGEVVTYFHGTSEENAGAHTLAAEFPKVCDKRNRAEWERLRLVGRWHAVLQHLRDHHHPICAAALDHGRVRSYNVRSLTIAFPGNRAGAQRAVAARRDEVREAVTSVMGQVLREVRCVAG